MATWEADAGAAMDTDIRDAADAEVFGTELDEEDRCAACQEVIPFDQLGKATCRNGHAWREYSSNRDFDMMLIPRSCPVSEVQRYSGGHVLGSSTDVYDLQQEVSSAETYHWWCSISK